MPIECCKCDKKANGLTNELPEGWSVIKTKALGDAPICPDCLPKSPPIAPSFARGGMQFESDDIVAPQSLTETTKEKLRQYLSKIENIEAEICEINDQRREVYADAKALGFDIKALKTVVKLRKKDQKTRQEDEMMLDLYLHALGEI